MLISKFDLYKSEWLELVFDDRNKAYGAYELRQTYSRNVVKAMSITFFFVALLFGASFILKGNPAPVLINPNDVRTIVHLTDIKELVAPPKKAAAPVKPSPPPPAVATVKDPVMVVTPDNVAKEPIKNDVLATAAIGPVTIPGKPTGGDGPPPVETAGTGAAPAPDVSIHTTIGLDVMPEPVGGDKAWAKFLNKNLRFPYAAQEEGASGRVILSFVIEKDGSLSNIAVERAAGHGFDEEALRVLKLAKAWKPGMQNGQAVRVRYDIPINFQLADSN
jgi:protein TonB